MDARCSICGVHLSEKNGATCSVKKKGLLRLIQTSLTLRDGKVERFRNSDPLIVHVVCRKNYTIQKDVRKIDEKRVTTAQKDNSEATTKNKLRNVVTNLNLREKCLFCDQDLNSSKKLEKKRRKVITYVKDSEIFKKEIIGKAELRNDDWGKEVFKKVTGVLDLKAAGAAYHYNCYRNFTAPRTSKPNTHVLKKGGRPTEQYAASAMASIFHILENEDECQFNLRDLMLRVEGTCPSENYIVSQLKMRYKDDIIIHSKTRKKGTVICLKHVGEKIISDAWYARCEVDEIEEKRRIVQKAAEIVREDIKSMHYDVWEYPSTDDFFKDVNKIVPEHLNTFLKGVMKNEKNNETTPDLDRKRTTIAHTIIAATRPRSFISPILQGISVYLNRKYGCKTLIRLLSNLGLCATYDSLQTFYASLLFQQSTTILPGAFVQFSFDNADFNCCSLDGLNTIHVMGGIQCVSPSSAVTAAENIEKVDVLPSASQVEHLGEVEIRSYGQLPGEGIKQITAKNWSDIKADASTEMPCPSEVLWLYLKAMHVNNIGGWNGFMQKLTSDGIEIPATRVIYLPFINSPPSDYDTILTALHMAEERAAAVDQRTVFVTFDQPLYHKAKDIVSSSTPKFNNVVVRLGGFHLLMNFLGCVGHVMSGSGLKDVLSLLYGSNTVDKMLDGHAYARAIRGNHLVYTALAELIFADLKIEDAAFFKNFVDNFSIQKPTLKDVEDSEIVKRLRRIFQRAIEEKERLGPTAQLWVSFFKMITLAKSFLRAERLGDWDLHIMCVKSMLPYFYACGHTLYAKSALMYVDDMDTLPSRISEKEYGAFKNEFFTIRRNGTPWSGTWSDMTIEQTLMRSFKSAGGLTRGRGMTNGMSTKWILTAPATSNVCDAVECLASVSITSSEQHVDWSESRTKRDNGEVRKIVEWFIQHPPFPNTSSLISISSGVIAHEKINCHRAFEVGVQLMNKVGGHNFGDFKVYRKDAVLPISAMTNGVKVNEHIAVVDPLLLFQRIALIKKSDEELMEYFSFELSPYPLSLFDECGMRKTTKSKLYQMFQPVQVSIAECFFVIDGGFLLHKVRWDKETLINIAESYVKYIQKNYGTNVCVIFDGYEEQCTKDAERKRRYQNSVEIDLLNEEMKINSPQETFLSNPKNKTRLITFLKNRMTHAGFTVEVAKADADAHIVRKAIEESARGQTVIVSEDIDVLVVLFDQCPQDREVLFLKPKKKNCKGEESDRVYSSKQHRGTKSYILLLHSFSGCDTTSAIFRKGKITFKKIEKELENAARVFNNPNATHNDIFQKGCQIFLTLYGGNPEISLNTYRYKCFTKLAVKNKVNLASLPPTEEAARQHSFRCFYQIQLWRGNELSPTEWGWEVQDGCLNPVRTAIAPAPDSVLKIISCNCRKDCSTNCSCRKHGLKCTKMCGFCLGGACLNSMVNEEEEEENVDDPEEN